MSDLRRGLYVSVSVQIEGPEQIGRLDNGHPVTAQFGPVMTIGEAGRQHVAVMVSSLVSESECAAIWQAIAATAAELAEVYQARAVLRGETPTESEVMP